MMRLRGLTVGSAFVVGLLALPVNAEAVSLKIFGTQADGGSATLRAIGTDADGDPANFDPQNNPFQPTAPAEIDLFLNGGVPGSQTIIGTDVHVFGNAKTPSEGLGIVGLLPFQTVTLRFTFLGSEAGFVNKALSIKEDDTRVLFTDTDPVGPASSKTRTFSVAELVGPNDLIPFTFFTKTHYGTKKKARNAGSRGIDGHLELAYTDPIDNIFGTPDGSVIAFFGDGGAGPDGDLDDMVVGIGIQSVSTVPVPPALPLLATGLLALGWLRRRKG